MTRFGFVKQLTQTVRGWFSAGLKRIWTKKQEDSLESSYRINYGAEGRWRRDSSASDSSNDSSSGMFSGPSANANANRRRREQEAALRRARDFHRLQEEKQAAPQSQNTGAIQKSLGQSKRRSSDPVMPTRQPPKPPVQVEQPAQIKQCRIARRAVANDLSVTPETFETQLGHLKRSSSIFNDLSLAELFEGKAGLSQKELQEKLAAVYLEKKQKTATDFNQLSMGLKGWLKLAGIDIKQSQANSLVQETQRRSSSSMNGYRRNSR